MTKSKFHNRYTYLIIKPDGTEVTTDNLSKFCDEHGIPRGNMRKVIEGKRLHCHNYWATIISGDGMQGETPKTPKIKVRRGFFRYKNVIRNRMTDKIEGYVEGNRRWYDLFKGETFYYDRERIYCVYIDHNGEKDLLYIDEIDISEYDALVLAKNLEVIRKVTAGKNIRKLNAGASRVIEVKGKWHAELAQNSNWKPIGQFDTKQEAENRIQTYKPTPGISYIPYVNKDKPWQAKRKEGSKYVYLGKFETEEEAIAAVNDVNYKLARTPNHKGVHFLKSKQKWRATYKEGKKTITVGWFETKEEAIESLSFHYPQ